MLLCSASQRATAFQSLPPPVAPVRHTVLADGHPLAVWEKRAPSPKQAILLLHGRTWSALPDFDLQVAGEQRSLMDALATQGYAVYALDLRGYGSTPRDSSGWLSPERAAKDVAAAAQWISTHAALAKPPVVLGWSNGAMVAQLFAQRFPKQLSALVLFGYPFDPDMKIPVQPGLSTPLRQTNTAHAAASDFITPGVISKKAIDAYVKAALAADSVRADWRELHEWNALNPAIITVPTLLIQAEFDPFAKSDAHARLFVRLGTADRQWIVLPNCDHAALLEDAQPAFVAAIHHFIQQPRPPK
ncbi:MAG: alpha/beta fold hydrolase [Rhizobacter sp.]|nr:alpha/beta fold hydrolase [Chlorobiales bacterium]